MTDATLTIEKKRRAQAYLNQSMAAPVLGIQIIETAVMAETIEDWSQVRSPSRAEHMPLRREIAEEWAALIAEGLKPADDLLTVARRAG